MTNKKTTRKVKKGYMVVCSKNRNWQAFEEKNEAIEHAKFLDDEYKGYCIHKVVPVEIIIRPNEK